MIAMPPNGILYQDYAKLQYGRMLWKHPDFRQRLLRHWTDPRHPHAERFQEWRGGGGKNPPRPQSSEDPNNAPMRPRGVSLRVGGRGIPSPFGGFFCFLMQPFPL